MIGRRRTALLTGCLAAALVGQASNASAVTGSRGGVEAENAINQCIHRAASGRPWLAQTLSALRRQEGGWIGAEVGNADGSVDLGPMQVNSWWIPRIARLIDRSEPQVRSWLRDDPCFNVEAARWIFLSALHDAKDFWRAVGIYHSPTRWRQMRYAKGIALIMANERRGLPVPEARAD
ncbi:lytic transglycosylase domain-containing protein [Sphingobium yanoikuyae]|jgi:hypothetical protein|uniref:lytic transglycosylase domain-containing protein n=1 Tax=Sphingobium yanoikuyae TaxID=13690 RepID=UPI0035C8738A